MFRRLPAAEESLVRVALGGVKFPNIQHEYHAECEGPAGSVAAAATAASGKRLCLHTPCVFFYSHR